MTLRDRDLVPEKKQKPGWRLLVPIGSALVTAWLIRLAVHAFLYTPVVVSGSTMEPALKQGEVRYVARRFVESELKPGDLVWIEHPLSPNYRMILTIAAREGDTVEVRNGTVSVNGAPVLAGSLPTDTDSDGKTEKPATQHSPAQVKEKAKHGEDPAVLQASFFDRPGEKLPPHSFYMLSQGPGLDSRHFGPVDVGHILGVIR